MGRTEVAAELLRRGANPHHLSMRGYRPLDVAEQYGSEEMIRLLRRYAATSD